ncbi:MAG: hypothetical protein JKY17_06595 [Magnetovibrio sp.]|nr:hypothetical protein [Magnetovibrio sp.]
MRNNHDERIARIRAFYNESKLGPNTILTQSKHWRLIAILGWGLLLVIEGARLLTGQ